MFIKYKKEKDSFIFENVSQDDVDTYSVKFKELVDTIKISRMIVKDSLPNPDIQRIIKVDAERIYKRNVEDLVEVLTNMYNYFGDYHQALGLLVGYLGVFLDESDIYKLISFMNNDGFLWTSKPIYATAVGNVCKKLVNDETIDTLKSETFMQRWLTSFGVSCLKTKYVYELIKLYVEYQMRGQNLLLKLGASLLLFLKKDIIENIKNDVKLYYYLDLKNLKQDEFFEYLNTNNVDKLIKDSDGDCLALKEYYKLYEQNIDLDEIKLNKICDECKNEDAFWIVVDDNTYLCDGCCELEQYEDSNVILIEECDD